ncbi:MAG: hypothetical protein ACK45I_02185, partial [Bacteroidota bacterium]
SILFMIFACSNKREQMLCKTWQVSDVQFYNVEQAIVLSDTLQGDQIEVAKGNLRDMLMKNIYAFDEDGTFKTGNAVAEAEGEWKLKNDALLFVVVNEEGKKKKEVPVEKLTDDSLILAMGNDQTSLKVRLILTPVITD